MRTAHKHTPNNKQTCKKTKTKKNKSEQNIIALLVYTFDQILFVCHI